MVDRATFMRESDALLTPLLRISMGILRAQADAEDAVQQALMKAWAARDRVSEEKFRPWLTRIVINESRNIQRYRMRVMPSDTIAAERPFQTPDMDVVDAVLGLPEHLRIPFVMKYLARYKETEIASTLRLPASTIKNRLARARGLLRDELTDTEVAFE